MDYSLASGVLLINEHLSAARYSRRLRLTACYSTRDSPTVERGEFGVEQHLLPAQDKDGLLGALDGNGGAGDGSTSRMGLMTKFNVQFGKKLRRPVSSPSRNARRCPWIGHFQAFSIRKSR